MRTLRLLFRLTGLLLLVLLTVHSSPLIAQCTPSPEVCDGIDNDCNGIVDDGLLKTDPQGQRYCLTIDPASLIVGQATTVTVRAWHEAGLLSVSLSKEGDLSAMETTNCDGSPPCVLTTSATADYQGQSLWEASFKSASLFFGDLIQRTSYACDTEYCQPDPMIRDFEWFMRGKKYSECVTSSYHVHSLDVDQKTQQKQFLRVRQSKGSIVQPYVLNFYDLVATDSGSTNITLGAGEGGNCQKYNLWQKFCPKPTPADYKFVETHFERSFGLDFTFVYHRLDINYAQTFGGITLQPGGNAYIYFVPVTYFDQFEPHSIVHFALQTYNGLMVHNDAAESAVSVAPMDVEPATAPGMAGYTHEWGHTWHLPHPFIPAVPNDIYVSLDGVMDNSYRLDTSLVDPTDSLERYALEPVPALYVDDTTFASAYSTGIIGSVQLPTCGSVDPAITAGVLTSSSPDYVFDLTLTNNGTEKVGYVQLQAFDGSTSGRLLRDRVIDNIDPGESKLHRVTIPPVEPNGQINVTAGKVLFVLDQGNLIAESNESNNTITVNLPPCVDADGDGYARDCIQCFNSHCPVVDCGDSLASVNPGVVEGPPGSAICSNGLDDDCDSKVDLADPGCSLTKTAVGETTLSGTKVNNYVATTVADGVYESLTEGGSKTTLVHTWQIDGVIAGASHDLLLKGYRPGNTEGDNFQFSYSTNGTKFTAIPNAVISIAREPQNPIAYPFPAGALSGTVYIRVTDTVATGSIKDTVNVDYLAIRTNP
jgi:hypothetical protein